MKIAYCIPSRHKVGGMERVLALKANYLADVLGWEVLIITTEHEEHTPSFHFSPKIRRVCLNVHYQEENNHSLISRILLRMKKNRLHRSKLASLLISERCDICVSMFCHEMRFLPYIKDGSKKVLELHFCKKFRNLDIKYNRGSLFRKALGMYQDVLEYKSIHNYDAFVVLTHEDAADWGSAFECKVIPNPLAFLPKSISNYKSKHVIAVGRLCPQKGYDMLVQAWALLSASTRNEWALSIYGDGKDKAKLSKYIIERGMETSVTIYSSVADIQEKLSGASIYCHTSRYEGIGMALMEAMSCGLCCVAFDSSCGPKDLLIDNYTGILVKAFDIRDLAENLQRVMEDEEMRRTIGSRASNYIIENFAIENVMKEWEKLFNEITK